MTDTLPHSVDFDNLLMFDTDAYNINPNISPAELLDLGSPSSWTSESDSWLSSPSTSSPDIADSMFINDIVSSQLSAQSIVKEEPLTPVKRGRGRPAKIQDFKPKSAITKPTKQRKVSTNPSLNNVAPTILLDRALLLKISCEEYDERVAAIESQRCLTSEEVKEVKRQRRLIKNRESALASRVRKRQQIETMEVEVSGLVAENKNLKEQVRLLKIENAALKSQLAQAPSFSLKNSLSEIFSFTADPFWSIEPQLTDLKTKQAANAATVCLFVFLFSFGIMVGSSGFNSPLLDARFPSSGGYVKSPLKFDSVAEPKNLANSIFPTTRGLLSIDDTQFRDVPTTLDACAFPQHEQMNSMNRTHVDEATVLLKP